MQDWRLELKDLRKGFSEYLSAGFLVLWLYGLPDLAKSHCKALNLIIQYAIASFKPIREFNVRLATKMQNCIKNIIFENSEGCKFVMLRLLTWIIRINCIVGLIIQNTFCYNI